MKIIANSKSLQLNESIYNFLNKNNPVLNQLY